MQSTPTCLGCAHDNVCQICELTDVIMQMHFYMFESFQLDGLYVTDLLHRFSVNVCSEGKREESMGLPVIFLFHVLATLSRNSIQYN